jgi:hypothetical protein
LQRFESEMAIVAITPVDCHTVSHNSPQSRILGV